jgi:peptide/nickel transport system substrate-binding protein
LIRRLRNPSLLPVVAGLVMIVAGCTSGGTTAGPGESSLNRAPAPAGAQDAVYHRPKVADIGEIGYGVEAPAYAYNNNIGATSNFTNAEVLYQVQPSAFFLDLVDGKQTLKVDGDLLSSFTVRSTSPLTLEYKIRPEAVWSDGAPVDCGDFYLQWLAGHSKVTKKGDDGKPASVFDSPPTGYEDIDRVDCADSGKTVTATFGTPFADYRVLFGPILPAHVIAQAAGVPDLTKVTDADPATVIKLGELYTTRWTDLSKDPGLSAGPYRIASSDDRDQTVLVRNERWWGNPGGPSKITYRTNADAQSMAQQLTNRELNIIEPQADGPVAVSLRGQSGVQEFAAGGETFEHLDFNLNNPLFADLEVRKAVSACVPRQELVDKLIKDVAPDEKPLGNSMFIPNEVGYQDHYTDTGNGDVTAAKRILEADGYHLGPDGIYAKDGRRVSFRIGHRVVQRREDTVRIVAATCRQAGIEVIDDQDENFNSGRLPAGEFDMALFSWVGNPFKSGLYGNYAAADDGGSNNYQGYSDHAMDTLYRQADAELNPATRDQDLQQVDKMIKADVVTVPLFQVPDFVAGEASIVPLSYIGATGGGSWNAFAWQRR